MLKVKTSIHFVNRVQVQENYNALQRLTRKDVEFWNLLYNEKKNYVFQLIEKQTPQNRVVNLTKSQKVSIVYHLKDDLVLLTWFAKHFFDYFGF